MNEQCKDPQAHPSRCGCGEAAEADWRNALRTANAHTRQLMAERDALHQQAEALENQRAEQWRLRRDAEARCDTQAAVIAELSAEAEALRAGIAEAVELIDCISRHPNNRIPVLDQARSLLVKPPATPAPEVQECVLGGTGISASLKGAFAEVQAEQGERQEAVEGLEFAIVNRGPYRILEWHGDNGCRPASDEECALWDALMSPQPSPDVRGLVEAGNPLSNVAYNLAQKPGHALTEFDCELLLKLRKRWDEAARAHRQAQRKGESHDN